MRQMTATEIRMGEERAYRESQEDDVLGAQSRSRHKNVRTYYDVIKHLPRTNGIMNEHKNHVGVLEGLDAVNGNIYYSERDEMFVGDWSIATPEIYHRHKELGEYMTADGMVFTDPCPCAVCKNDTSHYRTHIQWDAGDGECGLCGEQMSGEVMMMHKFYQF